MSFSYDRRLTDKDDLRYGHNSTTGNRDNQNWFSKYLWERFTQEHDKDGNHFTGIPTVKGEFGDYTGDGTDDRNISLSDTSIVVVNIQILNYTRTSSMTGDNTMYQGVLNADYIQSVGTGTFQVGTLANVNSTVYRYFVIGT